MVEHVLPDEPDPLRARSVGMVAKDVGQLPQLDLLHLLVCELLRIRGIVLVGEEEAVAESKGL